MYVELLFKMSIKIKCTCFMHIYLMGIYPSTSPRSISSLYVPICVYWISISITHGHINACLIILNTEKGGKMPNFYEMMTWRHGRVVNASDK
jgi:hypothetical protein